MLSYFKIFGILSFVILLLYLFIRAYIKEKEFRAFVKFHKTATETISLGEDNTDYPFFKNDRLHNLQHNIRTIEEYIKQEKSQVIEDKHNLQTIISDISHQVKTPIANIKMINEILLTRSLDEEQAKEFIQSMDQEINKLDFLMQSMITISLLETGIMKFNTRTLPIYTTIISSLNTAMPLINEKHIDVKVICDEDLLVKHDPKWTSEAIYNVIHNAAKFSPSQGLIVIKVKQGQFYTAISIKDRGPGIPHVNLENIFNKFYSKNNRDGSGIGLHLTERIIKGQHGYINVNSKINHGTEFILNLPND